MSTALQPLTPDRHYQADYRDEIEHAEFARILSELPEDHRARVVYCTGAERTAERKESLYACDARGINASMDVPRR